VRDWKQLIARAKAWEVRSVLLKLTYLLLIRIVKAAEIAVGDVLEYLTGNNEAWNFNDLAGQRTCVSVADWEHDLALLDTAILSHLDAETVASEVEERLGDALQGSLFSRKIIQYEANLQSTIRKFLVKRAELIWSCTSPAQRKEYYVAGLDIRSGKYLDEHLGQLVERLLSAVEVIKPIGDGGVDFLQDAVTYRLAWAMEAVRVHAITIGQIGADQLRGVAAMPLEAGSANRAIITLLRSGLGSRDTAIAAVASTAASFSNEAE
jgi:hypothetical protein